MNFVIDTNVIISSLYRSPSVPNDMIVFAFKKPNFVYYTESIFQEYMDVVSRAKFNFDKKVTHNFLMQMKYRGVLVRNINYHFRGKMIDNDDRKFYELAKSYDCYLITGNKKHYPVDSIVMTPKEFMDKLRLSA